jgi:hypothetical protein
VLYILLVLDSIVPELEDRLVGCLLPLLLSCVLLHVVARCCCCVAVAALHQLLCCSERLEPLPACHCVLHCAVVVLCVL